MIEYLACYELLEHEVGPVRTLALLPLHDLPQQLFVELKPEARGGGSHLALRGRQPRNGVPGEFLHSLVGGDLRELAPQVLR